MGLSQSACLKDQNKNLKNHKFFFKFLIALPTSLKNFYLIKKYLSNKYVKKELICDFTMLNLSFSYRIRLATNKKSRRVKHTAVFENFFNNQKFT